MNESLAAEQSRNNSKLPASLTQGNSFSRRQFASLSEHLTQMMLNIMSSPTVQVFKVQ